MTIEHFRYPTHEVIDAFVRAARHDRAEAIARLFRENFRRLAELFARSLPAQAAPRARQQASTSGFISAKERPMAESFWKTAAASLPPQVQWRYANLFEAAEKLDALLDFVLTSRGRAQPALARACRGLADALRNAARRLDSAAWRLMTTR